jgi:glycosyltransferase involved in cell wall biosynthesis
VVPYFPPAYAFGGPVKVVYEISRELIKLGHQVTVYTSDAKDLKSRIDEKCFTKGDGIQTHYMKNLSMLLVRKSKLFITPEIIPRIIREGQNFDIIHLHEYRTFQSLVVARYAKNHNIPYVLQAHGALPRIISKQGLKWLFDTLVGREILKDASKVIALNNIEAEQYATLNVPHEKIAVIPNGINLSEFNDLPLRGSFKKKFNIHPDEKLVLYLARINKIKGIDILVKAFANILHKLDDARLVIVGPDDGYLSETKALIKALKMEDNVLVSGPLYGRDKLEAYVDANLFVLPSRYETFPIVVLEAYACSKPIIASKVEAIPDIVLHEKTGLLFQACNAEELAKMIEYMFMHPEEAKSMGYRARKLVEQKFSIEKVVDSLEELYQNVLKNNKQTEGMPKNNIQIAVF